MWRPCIRRRPAVSARGPVSVTAAGGGRTNPGYTMIYNTTGWPSAVVRTGTSPEGLPIGIQMIAQPWNEHVSLAAAAYLEAKTGGWQKPPI